MHPAVVELLNLVPPPTQPNGAAGDWNSCEEALQLRFPEDYKDFISAYGSGTLCRLFAISSPFSSPQLWRTTIRDWWVKWTGIYDCFGEIEREIPYPRYPAVPGLLPWGTYGDVDLLSWYTSHEPRDWYIVYDDRESGFLELPGMGFGEFLVAALNGLVPLPEYVLSKEVLMQPYIFEPF